MNTSKFDDLLKEKLSKVEIPYDNSYWESAKEYMDSKSSGSSFDKRYYYLLILLLLFSTIGGYIYYNSSNKANFIDNKVNEPNESTKDNLQKTGKSTTEIVLDSKNLDANIKEEKINKEDTSIYEHLSKIENSNAGRKKQNNTLHHIKTSGEPNSIINDKLSQSSSIGENINAKKIIIETDDINSKIYTERIVNTPIIINQTFVFSNLSKLKLSPYYIEKMMIDPIKSRIIKNKRNEVFAHFSFGSSVFSPVNLKSRFVEAGISDRYHINKRISITGGINYFTRFNDDYKIRSETLTYDYIYRLTNYNLTLKQIHYLSFNSNFEYLIGNRSLPFVGIYASYNIGSESTLTVNETTQIGEIIQDKSETVNYKNGITPFDIRLALGYNYKINSSTELGIQYFFGFKEILKDNRFPNSDLSRNNFLSIDMKYKIGR